MYIICYIIIVISSSTAAATASVVLVFVVTTFAGIVVIVNSGQWDAERRTADQMGDPADQLVESLAFALRR